MSMTEAATARTTQADGHPVQRKDLTADDLSELSKMLAAAFASDASARLFHDSDYSDAPAAWEAEYLDDLTDAAEVGAIYTINGNEAVVLVFPAGTSQTDASYTGTKMNRGLARSEAQHRFRYELVQRQAKAYAAMEGPAAEPRKQCEILHLAVREDCRGRGHARRLLSHLIEQCKADNTELCLETGRSDLVRHLQGCI